MLIETLFSALHFQQGNRSNDFCFTVQPRHLTTASNDEVDDGLRHDAIRWTYFACAKCLHLATDTKSPHAVNTS